MQLASWKDSTASVSGGKGTQFDRGKGKQVKVKSGKVKKRTTPESDYTRLAERVWRRGRGKIKNKADFLSVYDTYMADSPGRRDKGLREDVFGEVQRRHKGVTEKTVTSKERVKAFRTIGDKPASAEFHFLATVAGRRVYARQTLVRYKKAKVSRMVFRDRKGRFAKKT